MEVMAVDSFSYLVVPRFWASLLIMPLMVLIANLTAITASYLVAVYQLHQDGVIFLNQVIKYVTPFDLLAGLCKGLFFGSVVAIICCYYGYNAKRGAEGVGEATNKAVVYSATVCVILNLLLTEFLDG
jgi:phospholipid/cholesterol/gamma-HCH transport system permease protein